MQVCSNRREDSMDWNSSSPTMNIADLPPEILPIILSHLESAKTTLQCRLVCRTWNSVIQGKSIWSYKLYRKKDKHFMDFNSTQRKAFIEQTPWFILYKITMDNYPFGQNLIRNCCGQDGLMHWTFGDPSSWKSEKSSDDDQLLESQHSKHTSFFDVSSRNRDHNVDSIINFHTQQINLPTSGLSKFISNLFQPKITVSFWMTVKSYSGPQIMYYDSEIRTMDSNFNHKKFNGVTSYRRGRKWHRISYTVENYGSSLRYIKVEGAFYFRPDFVFSELYDESFDPYNFKIRDYCVTLDTPNFYDVNWGTLVNGCHLSFQQTSLLPPSHPFFIGLNMNSNQSLDTNLLPPCTFWTLTDNLEPDILKTGKWRLETWPIPFAYLPDEPIVFKLVSLIDLREFGFCEFSLSHLQPCLEGFLTSVYEEPTSYEMKVRLISKSGTIIEEQSQSKEILEADGKQLFVRLEKCNPDTKFMEFTVEGIFQVPQQVQLHDYIKTITDRFHLQLSIPTLTTEVGEILDVDV